MSTPDSHASPRLPRAIPAFARGNSRANTGFARGNGRAPEISAVERSQALGLVFEFASYEGR